MRSKALLFALLLITGCGSPEPLPRAQQDLVAELTAMGGEAETDSVEPGSPVTGLDLHGTAADDATLAKLKQFPALRTLDLAGTKVTDKGLEHLRELLHLQHIKVGGSKITQAGIAKLKSWHPNIQVTK